LDNSLDGGLGDGGAGVGAGGDSRGRRRYDQPEEEIVEAHESVALVQQVEENGHAQGNHAVPPKLAEGSPAPVALEPELGSSGPHRRRWRDALGIGVQRQRSFWQAQRLTSAPFIESCFVAELEASKQDFLRQQFDAVMMVADAADVSKQRVLNLQSDRLECVKWPKVCGVADSLARG